jgi:signal transduction histidine kinase
MVGVISAENGGATAVPVPVPLDVEPRPERAAPSPRVLTAIALAGLAVAACFTAFGLTNHDVSGIQIALLAWISLPYIGAGLVAWWRRPESRLGPLMIAGGFGSGLSALQFAEHDLAFTVGALFDLLPAALFLHVYLSFPDGRLRSRLEVWLVAIAYASAVGLQPLKMAFIDLGPHNLLEVSLQPDVVQVIGRIQLWSLAACCLIGLGVLIGRRRRAGRPLRRSVALLIDSFALGLLMIAVLLFSGSIGALDGDTFLAIQRATLFVIGLSPIAFLIALLDARLGRAAVGDLVVELPTEPAPGDLRDALARALRDPSLELAYWLPDYDAYVDLDGRPMDLQHLEGRGTTLIDRGGEHVAILVHDPALEEEPELLDSVRAAAGIALENARLHAELRARLEELRGSRARIVEAAQNERQLLERNLHDGAQQRLIALSLDLSMLGARLGEDPDLRAGIDQARRQIAESLTELREISSGLHPAVVSGHGLGVALEQLAARATVPVDLSVELEGRLPEALEVAAYYVVSESLANVAKHAQASSAHVEVRKDDEDLVLEIVDDGVGGADSERGTGLRGLADRVESLDGRLRVWTPRGGGTRVRAEIPCA